MAVAGEELHVYKPNRTLEKEAIHILLGWHDRGERVTSLHLRYRDPSTTALRIVGKLGPGLHCREWL